MQAERHVFDLTTATSGAAEGRTSVLVNKRVLQIRVIRPGSNPTATGAVFTVKGAVSGIVAWSGGVPATVTIAPAHREQTATGLVSSWRAPVLADEPMVVSVTGGGSAKSAAVHVVVG